MALIEFDSARLLIFVRLGIIESYKPDKDMKKIYADTETLRKKTEEKMIKLFGEVDSGKAMEKIKKDPNLEAQWKKYLEEEYNKDVSAIINSIREKNKEICPGYKELLDSKK